MGGPCFHIISCLYLGFDSSSLLIHTALLPLLLDFLPLGMSCRHFLGHMHLVEVFPFEAYFATYKYFVPILRVRRGSGSKMPCSTSTKPESACQCLSPTNSPPYFKHYLFVLPNDATCMSWPWHSSFPRAGLPCYGIVTSWLVCCLSWQFCEPCLFPQRSVSM